MKEKRYGAVLLRAACVVLALILVSSCNGPDTPEAEPSEPECVDGASTRTRGCDEFKRTIAVVRKNGAAQNDGDWHPLDTGDTLSADAKGEAELNFSDCWDGQLWLFDNSAGKIRVRDCHKAQYDEVSNLCVPNGTWYSGKCKGEFSATTGSTYLTKLSTSFSITALPEDREISLVVVLEGRVRVVPVLSYDPTELGEQEALDVSGGYFYFTMPNAMLSEVAGLQPRERHSVDQLGPVAEELGVVGWMRKVAARAGEDGVLPDNWPAELGGEGGEVEPPTETPADGYVVTSGGGMLNDTMAQEAMYRAVDWQVAGPAGSPDGGSVTAYIGDEPVNPVSDLAYDPDRSRAMLEEGGYEVAQAVTVLYPAGDQPLEKAANLVARDLGILGVEAVVEAVPGADLAQTMTVRMQAGEPVIALSR